MNIKFCQRCGASVLNGGEYCEKCKAEIEGRPYIEPIINSGMKYEENINEDKIKDSTQNKISLEKKLHIEKPQGGIFGNNINTNNSNGSSNLFSSNSSSNIKSDYCYAVLILGIVSLFYNCCFIPSIACIIFFVLSRQENGISELGHTEILLSRIGLGLCIFGIIISLLYAVIFYGYVIITKIFISSLGV